MRTHRIVAWLLGVGLCLAVVGCGGGSSASRQQASPPEMGKGGGGGGGGEPGSSPLSPELAKGRTAFEKQDCGNCHMIHGQVVAGKKGGRAPDLGTVGAKPGHDAAWIAAHINDPTSHNPMSKMPKYKDKISAEDLKDLSNYLASLK